MFLWVSSHPPGLLPGGVAVIVLQLLPPQVLVPAQAAVAKVVEYRHVSVTENRDEGRCRLHHGLAKER